MGKHSQRTPSTGRKIAAVSAVGLSASTIIGSAGVASAAPVEVPNTPYTVDVPDQVIAMHNGFANQVNGVVGQNIVPTIPVAGGAPGANVNQGIGDRIAQAASSRVGSPYVWGATGPSAFDCSGLVQWAYSQAGINIPRVSNAQLAGGTHVSFDALQPGDIIGYYGGGHVGVYLGNGQVVHAPQSGQNVSIVPLSSMQLYSAARYF